MNALGDGGPPMFELTKMGPSLGYKYCMKLLMMRT